MLYVLGRENFCPSPRLTKNKSRAVNDHRAIPFNCGDSQLPLNEGAERRRATKNGFWKSSSARNRSSRSVDTGMISTVTHTTHNYHFGSSLIADGGAGRTPGYVSHLVIRDLKVESKPSGSSLSECFPLPTYSGSIQSFNNRFVSAFINFCYRSKSKSY